MKTYSFNLLPQKPKQEVEKEEQRDNASIYTAILPLIAVFIWITLLFFNSLVVDQVKNNWQDAVDQKQTNMTLKYSNVLVQHGELVLKTRALSNLIDKDIQPEEVFKLSEKLFPQDEFGMQINGYGRQKDGAFTIDITANSYQKFTELVRRMSNYDSIKSVVVNNVSYDEKRNEVHGTVAFFLNNSSLSQISDGTSP